MLKEERPEYFTRQSLQITHKMAPLLRERARNPQRTRDVTASDKPAPSVGDVDNVCVELCDR